MLPAIFDLCNLGHVGHRAACIQIGKNCQLTGPGQNVGTLSHEMHATEDDVPAPSGCGLLRKFVGVAAKVRKADDFVALIVVPENQQIPAQGVFGRSNAFIHGAVR